MRTYPATIHRPGEPTGTYDGYGNPIYGAPRDIEARCHRVRRKSATELDPNANGRQTLIVRIEAAFVAGTDLRETDEVSVDGSRYRVQGVYAETQALRYVHADLEGVS